MSNNTNNSPADTEIPSSASKEEIIKGLNEDLAREYKKPSRKSSVGFAFWLNTARV